MRLSYLGMEGKVRQLPYMEVEGKVRLPYLNIQTKVTLPYNEAMVCSLHFIYKYGGLDCHIR